MAHSRRSSRPGGPSVDLNGDVGEGIGHDAALMPSLTSANIACGRHAGDMRTMTETVALALASGVAIGAHPGFDDRAHFGRRELSVSPADIVSLVADQIRDLVSVARTAGAAVTHVKPHGALYNMAARDRQLARAVAEGVASVDASLVLFGLSGSELVRAGEEAGLRTASEAFADRGYRPDGSLLPRDSPGAVLNDPEAVIARAVAMVRDRSVAASDGTRIALRVDTLCVHGDTPGAAALAGRLRAALVSAGVSVAPAYRL
jgi:5-oxoprolinase (ATP-hydrolysing) subunit A